MLQAKNITKKFAGVTALQDVSLTLYPGKVTAIVGENGAGKSTLMKILSGVHTQYEGELVLNGNPVRFNNPRDAENAGIAIIHQELNLVPELTIAENIFLGREICYPWGGLNTAEMNAQAKKLLQRLHVGIDPRTKIESIKVGEQQLVEIAKALFTNASIIIMDEPTSAISDKEVDNLFEVIRNLKSEGKAIAYISHKLKELFAISDRFVVMRDGVSVDEGEMSGITQDSLIHKMTGRELKMRHGSGSFDASVIQLKVENLSMRHPQKKNRKILSDISFSLHKGEILGIYGLMGAGRTELMEAIFGLHPKLCSGSVEVEGAPVIIESPSDAIRSGIALVPEDRKLQGLLLHQSVQKNVSLTILEKIQRWSLMLSDRKEKSICNNYIDRLSIKTSSAQNSVENLSGGNQQKIVISKWLATQPKVLLLDEPTRGIDIHAKSEIYKLMRSLADEGMGIIMVSSELPEILAVADRVLVLCEGNLTADLNTAETSELKILEYAILK